MFFREKSFQLFSRWLLVVSRTRRSRLECVERWLGHPIPPFGRKCSWYCENSAITGSAGGIFPAFHRAISSSGGILTPTKTSRQHFSRELSVPLTGPDHSAGPFWLHEALIPSTSSARREVRHLNINRDGPGDAEGCPASRQTQEVLYCGCSCLITAGLFATTAVIVWCYGGGQHQREAAGARSE